MNRSWILALALLGGCASQRTDAVQSEARASVTPEMQRVAPLVGTWRGEARAVTVPEEMRAMVPVDVPMRAESTVRWVLSGTHLLGEGWHEQGPGNRVGYVELVTWDREREAYHQWFFSDKGEASEGWWTPTDDGFRVEQEGTRPDGTEIDGVGSFRFVDADTMTFEWRETTPAGPMELRGTSRRQ